MVLPLETVPLTTRRRVIDNSPMADGADVVNAARDRLQAARDAHKEALHYAAQQAIQRHMEKVRRQQMRLQMQQMSSSYPQIPAGKLAMPRGNVNQWIMEALKIVPHAGKRLAPGLYNMIMHESGGNPNAINNWDSNAKAGTPSMGLMQTIMPTFNAYALPGHTDIHNPVDNIIAGLRYAISRYGRGMVRAGGRHDSHGNYIGY